MYRPRLQARLPLRRLRLGRQHGLRVGGRPRRAARVAHSVAAQRGPGRAARAARTGDAALTDQQRRCSEPVRRPSSPPRTSGSCELSGKRPTRSQ